MKNIEANETLIELPFVMSEADAELFFETCENPPAPTPEMIEMFKQINEVSKWFEE